MVSSPADKSHTAAAAIAVRNRGTAVDADTSPVLVEHRAEDAGIDAVKPVNGHAADAQRAAGNGEQRRTPTRR